MNHTVGRDPTGAHLAVLSRATCLALLGNADVARIGVVDTDGCPIVLPVSYALVDADDSPSIVVRTRPGNILDRPGTPACIEIDGVDPGHDGGWSVLVRGLLRATRPDDELDPHPILAGESRRFSRRAFSPIRAERTCSAVMAPCAMRPIYAGIEAWSRVRLAVTHAALDLV